MDKFFSNANPVSWFANPALSVFQADFDADHYSDALIPRLNAGYETFIQNAVVKRKSEFIAGRYCAHQSLAPWEVPDGIIGIGEGRSPVWPAGIVGSISHCHAYALAVTARSDNLFAIGLDVEDVVSEETRNNIQKAVVNQNEMFLLTGSSRPDIVFTLIFSMKESFFKAAYPHVKFYFDFPAISLTHIDWGRGTVLFEVNQQLGTHFGVGSVFSGQFKVLENKKVVTLFQIENRETYSKATM
jgi:4'-phosphopantetheinyl transferase EntD